jgi:transcriptional regulator with XRE-family HTH domain
MTAQSPTGPILAEHRRACGLTQRDLAGRAGLHLNSIERLERFGVVPCESWFSLGKVTAVLRENGAPIPDAWLDWRSVSSTAIENRAAEYREAGDNNRPLPHAGVRGSYSAAEMISVAASEKDNSESRVLPHFRPNPTKPLCEATTRAGGRCQCKALPNGRCKFHGGLSTGPRTAEGRARIAEAQRQRWAAFRERVASGPS